MDFSEINIVKKIKEFNIRRQELQMTSLYDKNSKSLKVIAYPAFANAASNRYNSRLYSEIQKCGIEVIEFSRNTDFNEYEKMLSDGSSYVFHMHWPQWFFDRRSYMRMLNSVWRSLSLINRLRQRGVKIIWTIHNIKPHESYFAFGENLFWRGLSRRLDGVIALSETGLKLARKEWPSMSAKPSFVIPHGHYRDEYPNTVSRLEARRRLNLPDSAVVVGHTGLIRPYKNIPQLIRAFSGIERSDMALLVGGRPMRTAFEREVRAAASGNERVHLFLKWIADDELQHFLNAADLMVFPYRDILNSGSALLALSFDRPVLVPRLGAMAELQSAIGADWVRTYNGELTPAVLNDAIDWTLTEKRGQRAPLDSLDWPSIARQTIDAYRTIVGNSPR